MRQIISRYRRSILIFSEDFFKGSSATRYIALAYLTGILPIKKLKTQSALNNFEEFTMISPGGFAHYIGFTEDEVKKLCEKSGRDFELVKNGMMVTCWVNIIYIIQKL